MSPDCTVLYYVEESELVIHVPQLDLSGVSPLEEGRKIREEDLTAYIANLLTDKCNLYGSVESYLGFLKEKDFFLDYGNGSLVPRPVEYFLAQFPYLSEVYNFSHVKVTEMPIHVKPDTDGKQRENQPVPDIV